MGNIIVFFCFLVGEAIAKSEGLPHLSTGRQSKHVILSAKPLLASLLTQSLYILQLSLSPGTRQQWHELYRPQQSPAKDKSQCHRPTTHCNDWGCEWSHSIGQSLELLKLHSKIYSHSHPRPTNCNFSLQILYRRNHYTKMLSGSNPVSASSSTGIINFDNPVYHSNKMDNPKILSLLSEDSDELPTNPMVLSSNEYV